MITIGSGRFVSDMLGMVFGSLLVSTRIRNKVIKYGSDCRAEEGCRWNILAAAQRGEDTHVGEQCFLFCGLKSFRRSN